MVRSIKVRVLCDPCNREGLEVDGEEIPLTTIGTLKPRLMAFCEPHRKEFYDPFYEILRELGQVPERLDEESTPGSRVPCPVCGKSLKNWGSVVSHGRQQHDKTKTELDALRAAQESGDQQLPLERPSDAANLNIGQVSEVEPFNIQRCDQPDLDDPTKTCPVFYAEPKHQRPKQALGVHKALKHHVKGATKGQARATQSA